MPEPADIIYTIRRVLDDGAVQIEIITASDVETFTANIPADIAQELSETGELTTILEDKLGAGYRDGASERVIDVLSASTA